MSARNLKLENKLLDSLTNLLSLEVGETYTFSLKDESITLKRVEE